MTPLTGKSFFMMLAFSDVDAALQSSSSIASAMSRAIIAQTTKEQARDRDRHRWQRHPQAPDVDGIRAPDLRVPQFKEAIDGDIYGGGGEKLLARLRHVDEQAQQASKRASADGNWRAWVADAVDESVSELFDLVAVLQEARDYVPSLQDDSDWGLTHAVQKRYTPLALTLSVKQRLETSDPPDSESIHLVVTPSYRFAIWRAFRARAHARLRERTPTLEKTAPEWRLLRRLHSAAVTEERRQQRRLRALAKMV